MARLHDPPRVIVHSPVDFTPTTLRHPVRPIALGNDPGTEPSGQFRYPPVATRRVGDDGFKVQFGKAEVDQRCCDIKRERKAAPVRWGEFDSQD